MITGEDAERIIEILRALSAKYELRTGDAYELGQRDGRRDAYARAAEMVEECNHEEAKNVQAS